MLSKKVLDSIDDTYSFYNKETGEDESVSEVIRKSLIEERKEEISNNLYYESFLGLVHNIL